MMVDSLTLGRIPLESADVSVVWSPSALFESSELGVWYDPSDFSTMYQFAAGTTQVTAVGQSVGLLLDKSNGLVLGSNNAVLAGTWLDVGGGSGSVTDNGDGTYTFNADASLTSPFRNTSGTVSIANAVYAVSIDVVSLSATSVKFGPDGDDDFVVGLGVNSVKVRADTGSTDRPILRISAGGSVTVRSASVQRILGNHAAQATTASRPLLDAANLINYDGVDDLLTASNPNLGTDVTIGRATAGGVSILTGQTVGASYVDNTDHYGLVIVNRALTAGETTSLTTYLEGFIP
jgi:hypothetical protein